MQPKCGMDMNQQVEARSTNWDADLREQQELLAVTQDPRLALAFHMLAVDRMVDVDGQERPEGMMC